MIELSKVLEYLHSASIGNVGDMLLYRGGIETHPIEAPGMYELKPEFAVLLGMDRAFFEEGRFAMGKGMNDRECQEVSDWLAERSEARHVLAVRKSQVGELLDRASAG